MRWIIIHTLVILLILLLGASPFIGAVVAGTIADANGCTLHEGFVNPCVINGKDYGEDLYFWGVFAWVGLGTLPIAITAAGAYLVVVIVIAIVQSAGRRKAAAEAEAAKLEPAGVTATQVGPADVGSANVGAAEVDNASDLPPN